MLVSHWLVVFVGFAGLGSLLLPRERESPYDVFDAFWSGVFLVSGLLQVLQLCTPMRPLLAVGLLIIGITICITRGVLSRVRFPARAFVMLSVFASWATMASLNQPPQADFGYYHLPSVRWAQAYAAVPGLANLSWPLGHTSSFFVLTAAFDDRGFTWVQSYHLMGGVLVLALAMEGCVALSGMFGRAAIVPSSVIRAFGMVMAAILIGNWLPTLSPDVAVSVIGYATVSRLAVLLLDPPSPSGARPVCVLLALAGLGVTLKLTSAAYFGAVAVTSIVSAPVTAKLRRDIVVIAVLVVVFVGAWIARSAILTGYPFYPATVLPLHTSWTVPATILRDHLAATRWHTRGVGAPTQHWVQHWLRAIVWTAGKAQVVVPLGLGVGALLLMWTQRRFRFGPKVVLFMLPALVGCLAWFIGAPEPRFAGAMFWHLGIGSVALALTGSAPRRVVRADVIVAATITCMITVYVVAGARSRTARPLWASSAVPPSPEVIRITTQGGVVVYKPVSDGRCLDAPLPCSSEVDPTLTLRAPGYLGSGFTVRTATP